MIFLASPQSVPENAFSLAPWLKSTSFDIRQHRAGSYCVIDPGLLGKKPIIEKTGFAEAREALFRRQPSMEREGITQICLPEDRMKGYLWDKEAQRFECLSSGGEVLQWSLHA